MLIGTTADNPTSRKAFKNGERDRERKKKNCTQQCLCSNIHIPFGLTECTLQQKGSVLMIGIASPKQQKHIIAMKMDRICNILLLAGPNWVDPLLFNPVMLSYIFV